MRRSGTPALAPRMRLAGVRHRASRRELAPRARRCMAETVRSGAPPVGGMPRPGI
uniref:Uncharacterized protein n=2 Tax=Human herpesvirus 2 TaxID=10310 RepID=A0A481TXC9_HHV2|nr:hypothetical protein [Human alphaherpesvirus 2]QBH82979.1 hypothetical protein [Human alphaherpesvirus 2]QBH83715.1 hypothetical protein [Human alphaherpesvirus 2]QBH85362.1 hypothetical protein [Human alphaherpesvirus 2]